MTTPDPASQPTPARPPRGRRAVRLTLIILGIAVLMALVAGTQLSGR
ncbi:hypothetical protein ODJ79_09885 [Actinoplanes sp. KI2]|nr:hypothetical protein [Actinoplanes sp. KI2]MCU7724024.1 hypothetical protein [Actinoplanes sp. KI2]